MLDLLLPGVQLLLCREPEEYYGRKYAPITMTYSRS